MIRTERRIRNFSPYGSWSRNQKPYEVLEELEECVGTGEEVGAALEAKELTRSIGKLLDTLSPLEQNIFLRRYFFLEDAGAIAARYGLRRDSVNQSLCRTRKKLKAHLIQEGYAV